MTVAADIVTLLVELVRRGIVLEAQGGRLRFRPRSAMTDDLLARVKVHKPALLTLLGNTETPAGDAATRGFGSGGGDPAGASRGAEVSAVPTPQAAAAGADSHSPVECRRSLPPHSRLEQPGPAVDDRTLRCASVGDEALDTDRPTTAALPTLTVGCGRAPDAWRCRLLYLIGAWATRAPHLTARLQRAFLAMPPDLVEALEERAAIMQFEAGLSQEEAEAAAAADVMTGRREGGDPC